MLQCVFFFSVLPHLWLFVSLLFFLLNKCEDELQLPLLSKEPTKLRAESQRYLCHFGAHCLVLCVGEAEQGVLLPELFPCVDYALRSGDSSDPARGSWTHLPLSEALSSPSCFLLPHFHPCLTLVWGAALQPCLAHHNPSFWWLATSWCPCRRKPSQTDRMQALFYLAQFCALGALKEYHSLKCLAKPALKIHLNHQKKKIRAKQCSCILCF